MDKTGRAVKIIREVELEFAQALDAEEWHAGGMCPFLTCLERGPHSHGVCPECGAVKFGNVFCITCKEYGERVTARLDQDREEGA